MNGPASARFPGLLVLLFLGSLIAKTALANDYHISTLYNNLWFSPGPPNGLYTNYFGTNASSAAYGGSVLDNLNTSGSRLPKGGGFGLANSSFGQPVSSVTSDVSLGSIIAAPAGTDTNRPPANFVSVKVGNYSTAYYRDPLGGAFWVPSTGQIIAAQPNNVLIDWIRTDGTTNEQVVNVSAVPNRRPARLFWTEEPYDAPVVNLNGLFPVIHYNADITPPAYDIAAVTNNGIVSYTTNILSGVWLDQQKQLHAVNCSGLFLLEYYQTGTYQQQVQPAAVEVVQVLAPDLRVQTVNVGSRLLPQDLYWANVDGVDGVIPNVTRGLNDTVFVYGNAGPKDNWAFSVKRSFNEPWSVEIYWQETGLMNIQWPYEVDWYSADWPANPQIFVLGDAAGDQAAVLLPPQLNAEVQPDMDPPLHAKVSDSGRSLSTTSPGTCLLKYTTQDDVWFEVVQTVTHTNPIYFDLTQREWPIGQELLPGDPNAHAVRFSGEGEYVGLANSFLEGLTDWSVSLWLNAASLGGTFYSEDGLTGGALQMALTPQGQIQVGISNQDVLKWTVATTSNAPVHTNQWQFLTVTYSGGSDTSGTLKVYLDDFTWQTNGIPLEVFTGDGRTLLAAEGLGTLMSPTNFFLGKLDEIRVWSAALSADQVQSNRNSSTPVPQTGLLAEYNCNEGQGEVLNNSVGGNNGTLYGDVIWVWGQTIPDGNLPSYPGYVHLPEGDPYNVNLYNYPTEAKPDNASYVFGVNTGQLEVWWANLSRQPGMPPVYYPSRVDRYTNDWPANPAQIVIASGLGSDGQQPDGAPDDLAGAAELSIYYQNDPTQHGYNPNEEHALIFSGTVYALRNDLNQTNSSLPYVLVDCQDAITGYPRMAVFAVLQTNSLYQFERDLTAGLPIIPIMPLGAFPPATQTTSDTTPPAWQDRKLEWWARSAGDDGGTADAIMHFYYQMQPTFYFPNLTASNQPIAGTELPWLPSDPAHNITNGTPVSFTFHISWPTDAPKLFLGQTLTLPTAGLPDIWEQLSTEIVYEQSRRQNQSKASVDLFDPVAAYGVDLDGSVINAMTSAQLARVDETSGLIVFPNLPPSLYPRLYYDPNAGAGGQLVLAGQLVQPATGPGYLLLNLLEPFEQSAVEATASGIDSGLQDAWNRAVIALPTVITNISPNIPYVHAALSARLSEGSGFVTLAFNNSTNRLQVPSALPISLSIVQVDSNLYSGVLEVIEPADALSEELSMRYSADFAGHVDGVEFRWRYEPPAGGLIPNTDFETGWNVYGVDPIISTNEVTISGASPFTLEDNYFAVQYRPLATNGPSGTNWSEWTYNLAPGWVKRAMTGINPFVQTFQDLVNNAVDTRVTMMSQAGGPYEGDIALNLSAANTDGLIPTYETIFHRAKEFSVLAGISDASINETLLFAASRLNDLYNLLGNEAYADAQDPTVAWPTSLTLDQNNYAGATATSIFCFMNQEPNLLEEELALLRGRDDTLSPGVQTSPVYNRLIWNFTQGINGGEAAYAYNYNITGNPSNTVGVISADDAKRLYPQGHGDAWGHYLTAIKHYYDLLAFTNFVWQTEASATLVGNAAVSVDYVDEQKFAQTAAARARTGAQIVQDTFRQRYVEDPTGKWPQYYDSNTNRAWGIAEWASRAGQAAYYDWAVANSLMWDSLTNLAAQISPDYADRSPEGIEKIDRASAPELNEIAASLTSIQVEVDSANSGLNPLGLAKNVMPFDIDPTLVDGGQTHFEQIYSRALQAVYNAVQAYDFARGATMALRGQYDSVADLAASLAASETDYHNQLIGIYGYPYSDDIGPGKTYPQGYDGPDLINWQILDLNNLLADAPTGQVMQVQVYNLNFIPSITNFSSIQYRDYLGISATETTNNLGTISIYMANNGLKVKPPAWTGSRRAQGDLQFAMQDYVQAWYAMQSKKAAYEQSKFALQNQIDHQQVDYTRYIGEWAQSISNNEAAVQTSQAVAGLSTSSQVIDFAAQARTEILEGEENFIPKGSAGLVGPFPVEIATVEPAQGQFETAIQAAKWAQKAAALLITIGSEWAQEVQTMKDKDLEAFMTDQNYKNLLQWGTMDTLAQIKNQYAEQAELSAQVEAVQEAYQRIQRLLAQGQQIITSRAQARARAAQQIQKNRYGDLGFRVFRDDQLRLYQASFNLAARYTYLAAKAYDYETGLLGSDTTVTPGAKFLADVVRARLPGRFWTLLGTPTVADSPGEPGLADILARMSRDWDVVKGRFGINNTQPDTTSFSLRQELFRISPDSDGDATWAQALENSLVEDLNQIPEYKRYCRPFSNATNPEPGIVISFPSFIIPGQNFFGQDLAGGDDAYDPSRFATKIRAAGVWFTGYNNSSDGLADEPRVYLVPAGDDVLRSPTGSAGVLRHFTVFNQAMPLPFNVGGSQLDQPDFSPITDSLEQPFAQIRRFGSFRAYHDADPNADMMTDISDAQLVGRSVWNTHWLLIIPGRGLLSDPNEAIQRLIYGAQDNGTRDGNGISDISLSFQTYSISGD